VLADVGQGLTHDAVHGAPDHRRGQGRVAVLDELGRRPHRGRLRDQRGEIWRRRRLVLVGRRVFWSRPQDADQVPQFVQRLAARGPQFLGGLPGRLVDGRGPGHGRHVERPRELAVDQVTRPAQVAQVGIHTRSQPELADGKL